MKYSQKNANESSIYATFFRGERESNFQREPDQIFVYNEKFFTWNSCFGMRIGFGLQQQVQILNMYIIDITLFVRKVE